MSEGRAKQMEMTARKLFDVWSSDSIQNAVPFITDDFLLCDHALNRQHKGIDAVVSFFAETQDIVGLDFKLISVLSDEVQSLVAGKWILTATILKSGASVSAAGVSMLKFRGNLVCEQNDHYSATDVIKQLFKSHPMRALSMARRDLFS